MSITEGPPYVCECGVEFHFPANLAAHQTACQEAKTAWEQRDRFRKEAMELRVEIERCREIAERDGKDYSMLNAVKDAAIKELEATKLQKNELKAALEHMANLVKFEEYHKAYNFAVNFWSVTERPKCANCGRSDMPLGRCDTSTAHCVLCCAKPSDWKDVEKREGQSGT